MGEAKNKYIIKLSKEIWYDLLNRSMSTTAEYLSSVLNAVAYRELRKKQALQSGFSILRFFKRFLNY